MFVKLLRSAILITAALSISAASARQGAPATQAQSAGSGGRGAAGAAQNNVQMIVPIKDGLYLITGAGANSVIRVTADGIVLVDTKNLGQANYENLLTQIRTVSDKPIRFVVVEDVHQDKSGNTALFVGGGAQVIAHENEKSGLATYTNPAGTPGPPNVTYVKEYSIKMDGKEVAHLYHFGAASTGGDTITYFPDLKVVTMGDVFQAGINADYAQGGSILDWHKTLDGVLKLDVDTVIPNRGNPGTKADLQAELTRLNGISAAAIAAVKNGTTEDQLVAAIDMVDPTFQVERFLVNNNKARLDAFYAEAVKAAGK